MRKWSADKGVVAIPRTVINYSTFQYRSPAESIRFTGLSVMPRRYVFSALDMFAMLAENYRLDHGYLFSRLLRMSVNPVHSKTRTGMLHIDMDFDSSPALAQLFDEMGRTSGILASLVAIDTALSAGLRGMPSEVLKRISAPKIDRGIFACLWDSRDLIGSPQDFWEPSSIFGPLICRDVLGVDSGAAGDDVPVAPSKDEVGNFPLRLTYSYETHSIGMRLHFVTRIAMIGLDALAKSDDLCRLDMSRRGLPELL